jgi:hypothetical protein
MADPRSEPTRPERPPGSTNRPRPRPAQEATPRPDAGDNVLDEPAEPTDDSPTVISKTRPPADDAGGDLRGRRLAHFELIEQIGVGGMAAVLRARDTQLERDVALKILPPDMAADAENVRRFHQEARSAARLDHENIARVFFCGEDQGLHFIAFEFVEGENLRAVLDRRGRLPVAEALPYMVQLAAGLAHAAERGVVHRDIKPSNIIITPAGRAKLVDMGLARSLERKGDKDLTQSGVTLGTFDYISPEQALEPRDADVRSDIYSLGCTFYHMLTGRPPVPEGTAARKLHHHQHVRPADPRELAPLPDEIAVVLDRMMAKRPQDRYPTATALLQHLLAVARKLGVSAEAPEGLLFVDAALPRPGRGRPVLLAALAVAAVVTLIFLLEPPSPPAPGGPAPAPNARAADTPGPRPGDGDGQAQQPKKDPGPPRVEGPGPEQGVATYDSPAPTARDLAEWLQRHRGWRRLVVLLAGDLDVGTRGDSPPLVAQAEEVIFRPARPGARPTLRFAYDAEPPRGLSAALTIDSPHAVVEGLRFVVDARGGDAPLAGLLVKGGRAEVRGCDFFQARPAFGFLEDRQRPRLASVVVEAPEAGRARSLTLTECLFLGFRELKETDKPGEALLYGAEAGGVDAVLRRGPAALKAENCAFGPHHADFRLEGADAAVDVGQCTAYAAAGGAVFDLAEGAAAALAVRRCLFARPAADPEGGDAVVVRQDGRADARFTGNENRYFGLKAFWAAGRDVIDFTDWPRQLADRKRGSDFSGKLKFYPSRDLHPLLRLDGLACTGATRADEDRLYAAFQVEDRLKDLRASEADSLVGVERLHAHAYAGAGARLPSLDLKTRRQYVVDPLRDDPSSGFYATVAQAVGAAVPGSEVLLRVDGDLAVKPVELKDADLDLTVKPEPGFRPVLRLGPTREVEAALFRLYDGRLRLEGLEVRLKPTQAGFNSQVGVAVLGKGQATFSGCLFTLDGEAGAKPDLAAAAVADPAGAMMRMGDVQGTAKVLFENCFARGQGDLVLGRSARAYELEARNVLAALTGSLLAQETGLDQPANGQEVKVTLDRVTTWLNGPAVRTRAAREARGVLPLHLEAANCLFLPGPATPPLLRLEGPDADPDKLRDRLLVKTMGRNAYGPFPTLVELAPPDGALATSLGRDRWQELSGERAAKFEARLADPPVGDIVWAALLPRELKPAADALGVGFDCNALPRPLLGPADMPPED